MLSAMSGGLATMMLSHPAGSNWFYVAAAMTVIAVGLVLWTFPRMKSLTASLDKLRAVHKELKTKHKDLTDKERKQRKKLDDKRADIKKLKQDVAAQRKKNHAAAEDVNKLREKMRDQDERYEKALQSRPAFGEAKAEKKPEPKKAPPKDEPKAKGISVSEMVDKVQAMEDKVTKLQAERDEAAKKYDEQVADMKQMRRMVEGYRRVDIVSKSRVEVLEDKVRQLGRQYYDAVSEVALLKGEVVPIPKPAEDGSDMPRPVDNVRGDAADDASDDAEATVVPPPAEPEADASTDTAQP